MCLVLPRCLLHFLVDTDAGVYTAPVYITRVDAQSCPKLNFYVIVRVRSHRAKKTLPALNLVATADHGLHPRRGSSSREEIRRCAEIVLGRLAVRVPPLHGVSSS